MKTFKQHLHENYESAFDKAKYITKYLRETDKARFNEAMDFFEQGYKAKAVYNSKFGEFYTYGYGRRLEDAYKKMWDNVRDAVKALDVEKSDEWDLWSINHQGINKVGRIVAKYPGMPQEIKDFMNAIKDMPAAIKELKTYIIKGREPKPVDPNAFVKPMAPYEAQKSAMKFLQEAVDSFKKEYEASVTKQLTDQYNRIKDLTDPKDFKKLGSSDQGFASIFFMRDGYRMDSPFKLKPEPEKRLANLIKETVEDVIGHFVAKNTSKLALIFAKKPEVSQHKIIQTRIRNGMLENDMKFGFPDGSSFVITSQVIYKTSQTGKWFVQYPTRFRNVIMADGSKMSSPTEEKMIKEF